MGRHLLTILVLCLTSACDGGASRQAHEAAQEKAPDVQPARPQQEASNELSPALAPGSIRVRRAQIVDRHGFERPMVASSVLIPQRWETGGGVVWNTPPGNLCGNGYNVDFQAHSPDQRSAIHFFPMEQWQWNSSGQGLATGCPMRPITSVRQYLEDLVRRTRTGARLLDYRERPDIAKELQSLNQTTAMPLGEIQTWVEAGEVLIGYQLKGLDMRETLAVAAQFTLTRMHSLPATAVSQYLSGVTFPGFAMRAPAGALNFNMAELIRKSSRPNPQWTARIAQHNAKINRINVSEARKRSKLIAQTGEEIRQMQADSWRRYNESSDHLARERSEAIRGVETYDDPYHGGTVELDNTYDHAWQLDDGSYVLTDDADFNPYRETGQNGRILEVTK